MSEPTADEWRTAVEAMLAADAAYFLSPSILHHQTRRLRVEQLRAMRDGSVDQLDRVLGSPADGNGMQYQPEPCLDPIDE
jgi:hypothetical protein